MNVMTTLWFSSLLSPSEATPSNTATSNTPVSKVRVRVERIADKYDELSQAFSSSRPFLKMDTQGFDLAVFSGASAKIGRFLGIQSEVGVLPIYEGMPDWRTAIGGYEKAGFALAGFFPVSRSDDLWVVELDAVLVRSRYPIVANGT